MYPRMWRSFATQAGVKEDSDDEICALTSEERMSSDSAEKDVSPERVRPSDERTINAPRPTSRGLAGMLQVAASAGGDRAGGARDTEGGKEGEQDGEVAQGKTEGNPGAVFAHVVQWCVVRVGMIAVDGMLSLMDLHWGKRAAGVCDGP